jgi:hypothetical protein
VLSIYKSINLLRTNLEGANIAVARFSYHFLSVILCSGQHLPIVILVLQGICIGTGIHKDFSNQLDVLVVIQRACTNVQSGLLLVNFIIGGNGLEIQVGSTNSAKGSFRHFGRLVHGNVLLSFKDGVTRTEGKQNTTGPLPTRVAVTGPEIVVLVGEFVRDSSANALTRHVWHDGGLF